MKKTILYSLFGFLFMSMIFSQTTIASSQHAIHLWANTLVPSFFFPFIIVRLLSPYHLLMPLLKPLDWLFLKVFHINCYGMELIFTSLLLGFPGSSILLEQEAITSKLNKQAYHRLLGCVFMSSPNFILLSLSTIYPNKVTQSLLMVQLCSIFFMLLCTRNIPILCQSKQQNISFSKQMKLAMHSTIEILLTILVYLLIIYVLVDLCSLFVDEQIKTPLKLLSEFSSGCFYLSTLPFHTSIKFAITSILLSYGGLCVHLQLLSTLSQSYFHYTLFLRYRIIHIILSAILSFYFF